MHRPSQSDHCKFLPQISFLDAVRKCDQLETDKSNRESQELVSTNTLQLQLSSTRINSSDLKFIAIILSTHQGVPLCFAQSLLR